MDSDRRALAEDRTLVGEEGGNSGEWHPRNRGPHGRHRRPATSMLPFKGS